MEQNRDIALGAWIAGETKETQPLPYREFVDAWENAIEWDRFDSDDGQADVNDCLTLALYGYLASNGKLDCSSAPHDRD